MSRRCGAFATLVIVLLVVDARAEDVRLVNARLAYQRQDQDRTVAILTPAISAFGDRDRAAALRLLGCAHMVIGDRAAAIAAFRQSFTLEPDAALETQLASPDARSLFELARGEWRAALVTEMEARAPDVKRIKITINAPTRASGGRPLAIAVKVDDPAQLASRVELGFRRRGQPTYTTMSQRLAAPPAPLSFSIPADATESAKPFVLEYHVTVRHKTGLDLRRDGDPDRPHALDVAAGHRPRWHESWWARGALALGIIGLGAGAYVFYRSRDVGPQHVTVTGP